MLSEEKKNKLKHILKCGAFRNNLKLDLEKILDKKSVSQRGGTSIYIRRVSVGVHGGGEVHLSVLTSAHMCLVCVPFSIKAAIAQQA